MVNRSPHSGPNEPDERAAPSRRRGRPKLAPDDVLVARVAEAAWKLFVDRGYGGTTMQDVVAACGMSKRTVYRLFPGKAELFAEVVRQHRKAMVSLPGDYDNLPLEEALAKIFQIDLDPEAEHARSALMVVVAAEGMQHPELGRMIEEFGAGPAMALLGDWLTAQARTGRIVVPDVAVTVRMLMDVVFGAIPLKAGSGPPLPAGFGRARYLRTCFRIIADGLRARPGSAA
jgi:AcrR family transcriptional regulator